MAQYMALIGAGGLGQEVKHLIEEINSNFKTWNLPGFDNTQVPRGATVNGAEILGDNEDDINSECANVDQAIGSPNVIAKLCKFYCCIKTNFQIYPILVSISDY